MEISITEFTDNYEDKGFCLSRVGTPHFASLGYIIYSKGKPFTVDTPEVDTGIETINFLKRKK